MRPETTPRSTFSASGHPRSAFTLIELLIVMGIIAILIAILIPVAKAVRQASYKASTTAELGRIAAGINAYYTDFHAYPGPISEADIAQGAISPINGIEPTNLKAVTSSENLVLGLLGGLYEKVPAGTLTEWGYDPNLVTKGPQGLNPLTNKQYNAYVDVTPEELSPKDSSSTTGEYLPFEVAGFNLSDTAIPEFQDHIPGPILDPTDQNYTPNNEYQNGPILYMRARVGAAGIVTTSLVAGPNNQYDIGELYAYDIVDQNFDANDYPAGANPDSATTYFANPNITGQARSKDSYILISAGIDRIYGTKDDIIYSN